MCGIWALFGLECGTLACVCENFSKISHRGPDAFKVEYDNHVKVRSTAVNEISDEIKNIGDKNSLNSKLIAK